MQIINDVLSKIFFRFQCKYVNMFRKPTSAIKKMLKIEFYVTINSLHLKFRKCF